MKTPFEPSRLLDRGGKPTVRELLSRLVFNPTDGTIRLNGDRIVMQRAAVGVELRRELIRLLGPQEARIFLMRLGFLSGQADARFVRTSWPSLDIGDAFTAGTRLHTFSGVVRVETVYNDFDFRKKRFAGEFLWHDSVEAAEFRRLQRKSTEPVCWTQLGYASGYASEFFDTLIVYKEVACSRPGASAIVAWWESRPMAGGRGDPEVILFRERIATPQEDGPAEPLRKVAARTAEGALSELDRLILAPVREELDRLAPMALPVMIMGSPGTGRSRAAHYLHRASGTSGTEPRHVFGSAGRPRLLRRDRAARQRRTARRCRRNDPDRRCRESPARSPAASRPRDRGGDAGRRAASPGARRTTIRSAGLPVRPPVFRTLVRAIGAHRPHAATCRAQGRQSRHCTGADSGARRQDGHSSRRSSMRSAAEAIERADWPGQSPADALGALRGAGRASG